MKLNRTFVAGLPHLDVHTLSEDWALATGLESHWMLMADSLALRPSQWIDSHGDRMYGAVISLQTSFDLDDTIAEDDTFLAETELVSIRKPHALSSTRYTVNGKARAEVRLLTSFIKRSERGSNKKFSKVRDLWKAEDVNGEMIDQALTRHHEAKSEAAGGPLAMVYEVNRIQDFNTADFLYFKNFVRIAKAAEWRGNRGQPARLNSARECFYFGNVEDGDSVMAHVERSGDRARTVLLAEDGRRLFLSNATTPPVSIAVR